MAVIYSLHSYSIALLTGVYILFSPLWAIANTASTWDRSEFTQVRLIAATDAVGYEASVQLGLQFQMDPDWKIYWRSPGDAGSPPSIEFDGSTNVGAAKLAWPAPMRFLEAGNLETIGYLDSVVFPITVELETIGNELLIESVIEYQACKTICIPISAKASLELPSGPAAPTVFAKLIDDYIKKVPKHLESAGVNIEKISVTGVPPTQVLQVELRAQKAFSDPSLLIEGPDIFRFSRETTRLSRDSQNVLFEVPVESHTGETIVGKKISVTLIDGATAAEFPVQATLTPGVEKARASGLIPSILGIALLGGLILNLMPCVLPVLAIKVLAVVKHGGQEKGQVRASFIASASGILFSFLLLAAGATTLKLGGATVGWGMQFQEPLFLVFLILVLTIFSCNLFGFFEFSLPGWVGRLATPPKDHTNKLSLRNSFWTGALATLLATPCSAPFLGTAVGFALTRGPVEIMVIFATLGLGMASPYLSLAAVPELAAHLPKPGPWMRWVRIVMGVSLVGTIVWLLHVVSAQTGLMSALLLGALMIITGLILCVSLNGNKKHNGVALTTLGLLAAIAFAIPQVASSTNSTASIAKISDTHWQALNVPSIKSLVDAGNIVFVDVSAEWCLTCKVNKSLVLNKATVIQQLTAPGTVAMRGDWTTPDPAISVYLASFGRYGLPFNVVYGPATPLGRVLPELLSGDLVLSALQRAKGSTENQ